MRKIEAMSGETVFGLVCICNMLLFVDIVEAEGRMTELIQTMISEGMLILQYLSVRSLLGIWLRDCLSLKMQ